MATLAEGEELVLDRGKDSGGREQDVEELKGSMLPQTNITQVATYCIA